MANDTVNIKIKISEVGGNVPEDIRKALVGVETEVAAVTEKTERLSSTFFQMNQVIEGIQNIANAFSNINNIVQGYTAAYSNQIESEARLAQVMKNTMTASDAEIQSIKDLASAQQALGVIGDEVQLAGAQELATYMEKADSLKALLPVLNDVVAQQYGYNATAQGAVSIATMMGKVFEGQTSALSRYGYSFSEAEDAVLKFGTEEEKAATLAQVVSRSVGGVNQALADTPSGVYTQLKNDLGDLKERIGQALMPMQGIISTLAETGMAAAGIVQLSTAASTLVRVSGLAKVATAAWTAVQHALNFALNANPIGIIITAVGALVAGIVLLYRNCESFRNMLDTLWDAIKTIGQVIIAIVKGAFELWLNYIKFVIAAFKSLWDWLSESKFGKAIKQFATWIKQHIIAVFDTVTLAIKTVISWLKKLFNIEDTNQTATDVQQTNDALKQQAIDVEAVATRIKEEQKAEQALQKTKNENAKQIQKAAELTKEQYGYEEQEIKKLKDLEKGRTDAEVANIRRQINELQSLRAARENAIIIATGTDSTAALFAAQTEDLNLPELKIDYQDTLNRMKQQIALRDELVSDTARKKMQAYQDCLSSIANAFSDVGNALGDTAGAWLSWASNVVQSIAKALPQIAALTSAEAKKTAIGAGSAVADIPYVGPVMAVAAIASVIAAMASIPKFAQGGLAYGPTLGVFGEYQGARSNPEVIAPLSKLQDLLADPINGNVKFHIEGNDLVGIYQKNLNLRSRT